MEFKKDKCKVKYIYIYYGKRVENKRKGKNIISNQIKKIIFKGVIMI